MKSYELSYDIDFIDPKLLKQFQLDKSTQILKGDKFFIEKEIRFLLSSLETDHKKLREHSEYIVNVFFNGDKDEFLKKESYDYEFTLQKLNSILKEISDKKDNYYKLDYYFVAALFRKYALKRSMRETWYLSKRINFTNEFLAYITPKFSNILLSEDYISTGVPFNKGDIVNKESYAANVEELMNNEEYHHDFYFANKEILNSILIEIKQNIANEKNLACSKEMINIEALLKEASNGNIILSIYNK